MSKKVLVIGPINSGHIQEWLKPFLSELDITYFTLHPSLPISDNTFTGSRLTGTKLDFLLSILKLRRIIKDNSFDVIYISYLSSYGLLPLFLPKLNCRLVLSVWGSDVNIPVNSNNIIWKYLIKKSLNLYSAVNSPAHHISKKLKLYFNCRTDKLFTFQYGVNFENINIKSINDYKEPFRIVSIRNWNDLYHIVDLINGVYFFAINNPDIDILFSLYGGDKKNEQIIINLLDSKKMYKNLKVNLIGKVPKSEFLSNVHLNDCFISIPDKDGTPLSVLECAYIGLIPVLSPIDANSEWFDESSCIYINSYDVKSISDALKTTFELKKDFNKLNLLVNKNRSLILDKADYIKNTNRLKSILFPSN